MSQGLIISSFQSQASLYRLESYSSQASGCSESMCAEDIMDGSFRGNTQEDEDLDLLLQRSASQRASQNLFSQDASSSSFFSPVKRIPTQTLEEQELAGLESRPPGLNVFYPSRGFKFFIYGDLNLEKHFGYEAQNRLQSINLSASKINRILTDPVYLVETIAPCSATSILIKSEGDYQKILNFLFYSILVLDDHRELDRQYLVKGFLDLLTNYGYRWEMNIWMWLTVWTNYRPNTRLFCIPENFRHNFGGSVPKPNFIFKKRLGSAPFSSSVIAKSLGFFKELIYRGRFAHRSPAEMKLAIWLVFLIGLHRQFVSNGLVHSIAVDIISALFELSPPLESPQIQEFAVLLSIGFRPLKLAPSSRHWTTRNIPNHLRHLGHNHPLNMLYTLTLMPRTATGDRIRALMGYLYVQSILGVRTYTVPDVVFLSSVWSVVNSHLVTWFQMQESHTTMKAFIGLLDHVISSINLNMQLNSPKIEALKGLLGLVEDFRLSLPKEDSRELDPVALRRILQEVTNRWKLIINRVGEESSDEDAS